LDPLGFVANTTWGTVDFVVVAIDRSVDRLGSRLSK
jgi:hypothetical protein